MTALAALRAARACIQQERTYFADCNVLSDGEFTPDDAEQLAEYDAVLAQIDAALAEFDESLMSPADKGSDQTPQPEPVKKGPPFVTGDVVTWKSQAHGSRTTKIGEVVCVLLRDQQPPWWARINSPGMSRDHESYIVKVGAKHYWPRVNQLSIYATGRLASAPQPPSPVDQPVAWMVDAAWGKSVQIDRPDFGLATWKAPEPHVTALYAHPPRSYEPLELGLIDHYESAFLQTNDEGSHDFARAIERAVLERLGVEVAK